MKHVYDLAASVWIWLRQSNDLVKDGLLSLVSLVRCHDPNACEIELSAGEIPGASTGDIAHGPANDINTIGQFAAINALPYWYRGWTFQEATNKSKFLHYGDLKFRLRDWKILHFAISLLHHEISDNLHNNRIDPHLLSRRDREFLTRGNVSGATLAPFNFAELHGSNKGEELSGSLTHSNIFYRTSNPRDSVFALRHCFPMFADVEVDYEKPVETIFAQATVGLFRHGGVEAFRYWLHPSASPHLPSWAVDFTHCDCDLNENGMSNLFPLAIEIYKFDASATPIRRVDFDGSDKLHVAGFVFDETQTIGDPLSSSGLDKRRATDTACSWFKFAQGEALQSGISEKDIYRCILSWLRTVVYNEVTEPGDPELLPALGLANDAAERWGALMDLFATYIRPTDQDPKLW